MTIDNSRTIEIKRLNTPLTIKDSKAYDHNGKLLHCTETVSDVRFIVEPKENILTDDEVLQYAPDCKSASKIRLKRGFGDISDALLIHEYLPWILSLYYVIIICVAITIFFTANRLTLFVLLILSIIPLIYSYRVFNLNTYIEKKKVEKPKVEVKKEEVTSEKEAPIGKEAGIESLRKYENEVNNLKALYNVKEEVVRDLIKKRFEPPQITYDKFIAIVDSSSKLFYNQAKGAMNIINLAAEDTPRIENEIQNKINTMKKIIDLIEDLTNELVININDEKTTADEVNNLLEDMENLIGSVKEY